MSLLFKVLKYESEIFEKYQKNRAELLKFIGEIEINNIPKEKILIFINDLKQVIDPLITCSTNIEYLISNKMESNESVEYQKNVKEIFNIYFFLEYLRLLGGTSDSLDSVSDSELEILDKLESVSDSVSVSVSE